MVDYRAWIGCVMSRQHSEVCIKVTDNCYVRGSVSHRLKSVSRVAPVLLASMDAVDRDPQAGSGRNPVLSTPQGDVMCRLTDCAASCHRL